MPYTDRLYKLQRIDSKILSNKRRLKAIAANLKESDALREAREKSEAAQATLVDARTTVKNLELDVKELQTKIKNHQERLYGGKVANPKEASALQDDIDATQRWLGKKEDDLINAMDALTAVEQAAAEASDGFDGAKATWDSDQGDLLAEEKTLKQETVKLVKVRPSVEKFISERDLQRYEQLRRKKRGIAVSSVKKGICTACGVLPSHRLVQQAAQDQKLHFCDNCDRILHVT